MAEERHEIEVRLRDGWTPYKIAKLLGRAYNTIKNEIERGTVMLYNGKVSRYKAQAGEAAYLDKESFQTSQARYHQTQQMLAAYHPLGIDQAQRLPAAYGTNRP